MDASTVIVEAHAELERLFAAYEATDGGPVARSRTLGAIAAALGVHQTIASELLYPALQAQTCRYDADVRRQLEQAQLLDLLAAELAAMAPTDPRYDPKVQVLQQLFRLHVRDEETQILPEVRRRLDPSDRERLGRDLLERTRQLTSRQRPRRPER
jgi:Hemerythrin HHE cation binding domain